MSNNHVFRFFKNEFKHILNNRNLFETGSALFCTQLILDGTMDHHDYNRRYITVTGDLI